MNTQHDEWISRSIYPPSPLGKGPAYGHKWQKLHTFLNQDQEM